MKPCDGMWPAAIAAARSSGGALACFDSRILSDASVGREGFDRPDQCLRRARPLLGTLVEVGVYDISAAVGNAAIDAAMATVERVHRLMSFHDSTSDVSRLNQLAASQPITVDPWTTHVLSAAKSLSMETEGAFNITIAPLLQRWGYLPRNSAVAVKIGLPPCQSAVQMSAIVLAENRVRFLEPLRIDLGGIAKGFAVDQAVAALQSQGIKSGFVNAGGDLRLFGLEQQRIYLRHPAYQNRAIPLGLLSNCALATSATYFTRKQWRGKWVSQLVDPRRQRPYAGRMSVSIQAPTCMIADALTKVVFARRDRLQPVLKRCCATAFLLTHRGDIFSTEPLA